MHLASTFIVQYCSDRAGQIRIGVICKFRSRKELLDYLCMAGMLVLPKVMIELLLSMVGWYQSSYSKAKLKKVLVWKDGLGSGTINQSVYESMATNFLYICVHGVSWVVLGLYLRGEVMMCGGGSGGGWGRCMTVCCPTCTPTHTIVTAPHVNITYL